MSKRLIVNATLAVGVASAGSPALAQVADDSATLEQRFRIEQEFGVGDNLGLQTPSEGTTSLATTRLSYGLESKTRAQELSLAVGAALRFGSIAEGNTTSTGLVDPFVGLRYRRDAANASFSVNGDYRQSDISLAAPLWAFLDQDGIVRGIFPTSAARVNVRHTISMSNSRPEHRLPSACGSSPERQAPTTSTKRIQA